MTAGISADCAEDLEHADLAAMACMTIAITRPIRFGYDLDADLRHLRWLRDVTSHAIRLTWTLEGAPLLDRRDYCHLVPPSAFATLGNADVVTRWRSEFRYGTFYYRVGPGFVTVKDVRPGGDHARMTISGPDAALFSRLAQTSCHQAGDEPLEAALSVMSGAGLARYTRSSLLVLPFRLRHWPVPFLSI